MGIRTHLLTFLKVIAVLSLLIAASTRAYRTYRETIFSVWADRDFSRAETSFQWRGPEMQQGGRTLGGAYYIVLRFVQMFGDSPQEIRQSIWIILLVAITSFSLAVARHSGYGWALFSSSLIFFSHCTDRTLTTIWNPTIAFVLSLFAWACFYRYLSTRSSRYLFSAVAIFAIAIQCHFTYGATFFALVVTALFFGMMNFRDLLLSFAVVFAIYFPYLVYEKMKQTEVVPSYASTHPVGGAQRFVDNLKNPAPQNSRGITSFRMNVEKFVFSFDEKEDIFFLFRYLPLIGLVLGASRLIVGLFRKRRPAFRMGSPEDLSCFHLSVVFIYLLILCASSGSFWPRYFLPIIPSLCLLVAGQLKAIYESLPRNLSPLILVLACVFSVQFSIFRYIPSYEHLKVERFSRVLNELNQQFGMNQQDLLERTTLFTPDFSKADNRGAWLVPHGTASGWQYSVSKMFPRSAAASYQSCIAIVMPRYSSHVIRPTIKNAMELVEGLGIRALPIALEHGDEASYLFFESKNGYCPRMGQNAYLVTPEERSIFETKNDRKKAPNVFQVPGHLSEIFVRYESSTKGLVFEIFSPRLRGYTGTLYDTKILTPMLYLMSKGGPHLILPISYREFGYSPMVAPIRLDPVRLDPDTYDLSYSDEKTKLVRLGTITVQPFVAFRE